MQLSRNPLRRRLAYLPVLLMILSTVLTPAAFAQAEPVQSQSGLVVTSQPDGLHLDWQGGVAQAAGASGGRPLHEFNGLMIAWESMLVELPANGTVAAASITDLNSVPYTGELTPAPIEVPPALDWQPLEAFFPAPSFELPSAPVFILAEGQQRGKRLATVGFSPIYRDPTTGEVRYVESLSAQVAGASMVADLDAVADPDSSTTFAPVPALAAASGPTNGLAASNNVVKLTVADAGMQEVTGGAIAAAGLSNPNTDTLRLLLRGIEVPLHIIDRNNDKVLNASDAIRFYAPAAGDRYNATSVYWLYVAGQNGVRMASRPVTPGNATVRTTALEVGQYRDIGEFQSSLPGADGDYWFITSLDTQTSEDTPPADQKVTATLAHQLPLNNTGDLDALATVNATVFNSGNLNGVVPHRLTVKLGGQSRTDGVADWPVDFSLGNNQDFSRDYTLDVASADLEITLLADGKRLGVALDWIEYLLPTDLNFGGKGAVFEGVPGTWRYQLSNTAAGSALYDITDPSQPQVLAIPGAANFTFQDGADPRRYLVTGPGTVNTPVASAHTPVTFNANGSAHIVYITPDAFKSALQPLVDLRTSQNYVARVVDVQAIFDAWSYGMVDPAAIRTFLQFAVGNWNPAPLAAVLVGDGTWDPHNYLGYGNGNFVPPYMLDVDPYIHLVPCDSCYGQLDGSDPLSEEALMPDIWIGRFPVNTTGELTDVVTKIVNYEKDNNDVALWRRRVVQIADDFIKPDGQIDNAGNFPEIVETIIAEQPDGIESIRHYYGAYTDFSALTASLRTFMEGLLPYFVGDNSTALKRSVSLMNGGAAIVTYTGHSNHWQWAVTDISKVEKQFDARLFGLYDTDLLNNSKMPFIALSMTCYTSQFGKPAPDPKTLDEDLFLHRSGGAVATIGSSGLSVTDGHDTLQEGFYHLLWQSPRQKAKLGALLSAGFQEVAKSGKHFDVNHTFLLLGDPFTPARVQELSAVNLPNLRADVAQR